MSRRTFSEMSPTITTTPRRRVTSIARLITASDLVAAVRIVRSAPWPPVKSRTSPVNASASLEPASRPSSRARSPRDGRLFEPDRYRSSGVRGRDDDGDLRRDAGVAHQLIVEFAGVVGAREQPPLAGIVEKANGNLTALHDAAHVHERNLIHRHGE